MHSCTHTHLLTPHMLSSPWASPCKGDWAPARPSAPFIYKGVTTRNRDAHSNIIGMALPWLYCLILTHRVGSQKGYGKKWGKKKKLWESLRWDKGEGWDRPKKDNRCKTKLNNNWRKKYRATESDEIKWWRLEAGDIGVIDMTERVRTERQEVWLINS